MLDPGESCSDVPPLGSENASAPVPPMAVPAGGTNGANGFAIAIVDEDAGIIGVVWIGPLLPLPCGNGSKVSWLGCGVAIVDDTIAFGSIAVDVIVVDMIELLLSVLRNTARHAVQPNNRTRKAVDSTATVLQCRIIMTSDE